uniref:Uncharacterized protein n=1 Tax=Romanomermis culicivorax TaxID=13658 RepID=A0A915JS05_ROMCU
AKIFVSATSNRTKNRAAPKNAPHVRTFVRCPKSTINAIGKKLWAKLRRTKKRPFFRPCPTGVCGASINCGSCRGAFARTSTVNASAVATRSNPTKMAPNVCPLECARFKKIVTPCLDDTRVVLFFCSSCWFFLVGINTQ